MNPTSWRGLPHFETTPIPSPSSDPRKNTPFSYWQHTSWFSFFLAKRQPSPPSSLSSALGVRRAALGSEMRGRELGELPGLAGAGGLQLQGLRAGAILELTGTGNP